VETFIWGVNSGMTCHNTSCQHKITVCILVPGSSGDALRFQFFTTAPLVRIYPEK